MSTGCKLLTVERLAGGELDGDELLEARRHIETCGECAAYVTQLETERTAFLREHPFSSFTRAHSPVSPLPWYALVARRLRQPMLLPAYGALLIAVVALPPVINQHRGPDVQFKGAASPTCMVRRGSEVFQASAATSYRAGDQVQIMFPMATRRYVCLISVDARGTVSFYHPDPQAKSCSVAAGPGSPVAFPGSMVLDDVPGSELAVVLFSSRELVRDSVEAWAKRQFDACRDVVTLRKKLSGVHDDIAAEIVTMLLLKE